MEKIKIAVFTFILCGLVCVARAEQLPKLLVFYSPSCHRCEEIKKNLMPKIEKRYKDRISLEYLDLSDIEVHKLMLGLKDKYEPDMPEFNLPVFFMQGKFLNTKDDLGPRLVFLIEDSLRSGYKTIKPSGTDLIKHFESFRPLVILGAGLVDGINPCAFTVIVFFISFLALQGYKKRELIAVGFAFISAIFITYSLIGLGIFNFLYRIKSFWLFVRVFSVIVGIMSISLGILALYDLLKFLKTKETAGLILQLPKTIKESIHSVIRLFHRNPDRNNMGAQQVHLFRLVLSALISGFLVSILEAVCTGQLYLPTIAFVLKSTPLKLQAFGYLVAYNIMFIIPLVIIFCFALLGVTSAHFAAFLKKHLAAIKVTMAFVFLSLGIFLIWRG